MAVTMTARDGAFLLSEAPGALSRESIVIASGSGVLEAGTVLGKLAVGAATAGTIQGTGNATISSVTVGAGAVPGAHRLVAVTATMMQLFGPNGQYLGNAAVGSAQTVGGLTFTVTAGGTAMVAGSHFVITVAAGTGQYGPYDDDNTDGTETAAGILLHQVDATSAAADATAIVRLAEVDSSQLVWASTNDSGDKTAGLADLAALNIIARS